MRFKLFSLSPGLLEDSPLVHSAEASTTVTNHEIKVRVKWH
jgi:hypothetical protein